MINYSNDLEDLPLIDKKVVISNYTSFIMDSPYCTGQSSGTSGQPIKIPYSKQAYQKEYAFWWYHRSFGNIHRGDKIATIAGHKIADVTSDKPPFWIYNMSDNQMLFSSYHMSPKNMPHYVEELNHFKPVFIHGYPSSISMIASYILENSIMLDFRPRMIATSSETLLDFQRRNIEQAFGTKVSIFYGNSEFCGNIIECPNGKLHVQPYHSYVRILKDDGNHAQAGEQGRIVATNFANFSFALVNYDMRDIVQVSLDQSCTCGKGGLVLDSISGRMENYIITPEGRWVGRLDHLFKDAQYVRNAQIEQNDPSSVIIRIESEPGYSSAIEKTILEETRIRMGRTISVRFEYVREIEKLPNGKFPFILQKIRRMQPGGN
jgi:phenylacetate-CoA ligase